MDKSRKNFVGIGENCVILDLTAGKGSSVGLDWEGGRWRVLSLKSINIEFLL
jgi:hypothetical protein